VTETSADFVRRVGLRTDPVADPAAVVTVGSARFTVLTARLLRLEYSADGQFEDRGSYAFPVRRGPVPEFSVSREGETTCIDTGPLLLRYRRDGQPFSVDNLSIEVRAVPDAIWTPGQRDRQNLGGARRTVDNCRGPAALEPGLVSRSGWALHDDGPSMLIDADGWASARPDSADLDWYFFGYGHDYPDAITEYLRFGGSVPLVPRWLLGAWWSRYWAYRDADLRELVSDFGRHGLPLDVLVIDMDWHLPDSWTGYTWNQELFPDPAGFLSWLHQRGLRATLNLHPALGVQPFERAYAEFRTAMNLPAATAGPGAEAQPEQSVPFQVGDPDYMRHYFELLHHPLEDEGVDFWWMDWQQGRLFGDHGLDPLPWLNHLHFVDLGRRPDRRPIAFSRWGGLGSHRYPIGFSGDSYARWEALRFQPRYTAAGANVAYGWWSHDIGGHVGPDDPELYVRWVQFGAFSPVLRLHSNQDPDSERRPWAFGPQVLAAARAAFGERYRLLPYLYTAARVAADTGIAPVRPLSWLAPADDSAYAARFSYLLGADLLVAPVLQPADPATGLATVDVWLPPGQWVERTTLERIDGPAWTRQLAELDRVPQFVRLGTVLPLADGAARNTGEQPADQLILSVFPGADGSARVYADDGSSSAFAEGRYSWTEIELEQVDENRCVLSVDSPLARDYTIRLEGCPLIDRAEVDGVELPAGRVEGQTTVLELGRRESRFRLEVVGRGPLCGFGSDHNAELRRAEVSRLIGDLSLAELPVDHPGRAAAIARLGGPAIAIQEHTTPDEAAEMLGRLVIGKGPGQQVRVQCTWQLQVGGTLEQVPVEAIEVPDAGLVLEAPCRWDDSLTPTRWSVEVQAEWDSEFGPIVVTERFDSAVLSPGISSWAVAVTEPEVAEPGVRDWQLHRADPFDIDFAQLSEPYEVPLQHDPGAVPDRDLLVHARTRLSCASDCTVAFQYWASGTPVVLVDGVEVAADVTGNPPARHYDLDPAARRTAPVALTAGEHELVLRGIKDAELYWYQWTLAVVVLDAATGQPRLDVSSDAAPLIARF